jgi:hypothetical protein
LLPDGKVLIVGGTYIYSGPDAPVSTVLDSFELYTPASQSSTVAGVLQTPRVGHTATLLNNGQVLIIGGTDNTGNPLASAELYK